MKKSILILLCSVLCGVAFAQEKVYFNLYNHLSEGCLKTDIDTVYFNDEGSEGYFRIGGIFNTYSLSQIDSITFGDFGDYILVRYDGDVAYVVNPFAFDDVEVTVDGANVSIDATTKVKDIAYYISGQTDNGSLKIDSKKRFNLVLNGVELSNSEGPAINIQSKKKATITVSENTTNTLTDAASYDDEVVNDEGESEEQSAAFFSEGDLVFTGTGSLIVNGTADDKHAICSDEKITIEQGNITVNSAAKDALHGKEGVEIVDGTAILYAQSDAIDGDEGTVDISGGSLTITNETEDGKGIKCDSTINISGGVCIINILGDAGVGIKSKQKVNLIGGDITVYASGAAVLESSGSGYDPSYCTAIKGDNVIVDNAAVEIQLTGIADKGISSDSLTVVNSTVKITSTGDGATYTNEDGESDAYRSTCLTADMLIYIESGDITLSASGTAGVAMSCDDQIVIGDVSNCPTLNITTTGEKITISGSSGGDTPGGGNPGGGNPGGGHGGRSAVVETGGENNSGTYAEAKAITCDGDVSINNGTITISSADDGIKAEKSVSISNADLSITESVEGIESPSITLYSGNVSIMASDDGFNATYGTTSGGTESNDGSLLSIQGGRAYANSSDGDAVDSNGEMEQSGGVLIIQGPNSSVEESIDVNGDFVITGGFLIAAGANQRSTSISSSSTQDGLSASSSSSVSTSTIFRIEDADGNEMVTFKPLRTSSSFIFSSPELVDGTYKIYTGGTCTGTLTDGLYDGGEYSGGTAKTTFTISSTVTSVSF